MRISRKKAAPQATYGSEALRLFRAAQGAGKGPTDTIAPEPECLEATTGDPPAPLPSGTGFAVVVPLYVDGIVSAAPRSEQDALTIEPRELPATWVRREVGRVEFWYGLVDPPTTPIEEQATFNTMWRVWRWFFFRASARGLVVAEQQGSIRSIPTESAGLIRTSPSLGYRPRQSAAATPDKPQTA